MAYIGYDHEFNPRNPIHLVKYGLYKGEAPSR